MKEENNTDGLYYLKIDARHYFPDGKIARDVLEALRCRQYAAMLAFYLERDLDDIEKQARRLAESTTLSRKHSARSAEICCGASRKNRPRSPSGLSDKNRCGRTVQPDEQPKEKEDEMDDNKNKPMGWPILYTLATLAGVAVLAILKACGIISMSWPVVIAGLVWVPTALLLITLWVATLLIWIGRTEKKIREYNRRRKISRTLDESMKGLTLNGVGPIYGIRRNKGENNTDYEKRIREKLGLSPRSLPKYETMEQLTLSNVGPIYGVVKKQDESWKRYRRRILKAARTLDTVNVQNAPKPRKE